MSNWRSARSIRCGGAAVCAVVGWLLAGCVPSEEEIQREFDAYVNGANACAEASECAVAYAECPLGCFVAVRADRVASVERKARELVDDYESGGEGCTYDCVEPGAIECTGGRCAVAPNN